MQNETRPSLQNEPELVERAALGDRDAYAELYEFYIPRLYKYLYPFIRSKEDTEEILHDIFLGLWLKRTDLSKVRLFNSFIFRIARNRLMNLYDHEKVKRKAFDYISKHSVRNSATTDERLIYRQYQNVLEAAISSMPPKRRQVYEMCMQQELSYDEIAGLLGITKSMVKKQVYAARDHVKEYLLLHAGISLTIIIAATTVTYSIGA